MSVFSRFLVRTALSFGPVRRYVAAALAITGAVAGAGVGSAIRITSLKRALHRSQRALDAATKRLPGVGKTSLSAGIGAPLFEATVPAR